MCNQSIANLQAYLCYISHIYAQAQVSTSTDEYFTRCCYGYTKEDFAFCAFLFNFIILQDNGKLYEAAVNNRKCIYKMFEIESIHTPKSS